MLLGDRDQQPKWVPTMQVTHTTVLRRLWPEKQYVERLSAGQDVEECAVQTATAHTIQVDVLMRYREFPANCYALRLYFFDPWDGWDRWRRDNHGTLASRWHNNDLHRLDVFQSQVIWASPVSDMYFIYTRPTSGSAAGINTGAEIAVPIYRCMLDFQFTIYISKLLFLYASCYVA